MPYYLPSGRVCIDMSLVFRLYAQRILYNMIIIYSKSAVRPMFFVFMLLSFFIFVCSVMSNKEIFDAFPHGSNAEIGTIQRIKNSDKMVTDYGSYVLATMLITDKYGNSNTSTQRLQKEYLQRFLDGDMLTIRYFKGHPEVFRMIGEQQPSLWSSSMTNWLIVSVIATLLFWVSLKLE